MIAGTAEMADRREDFPVESFRFLEAKLQEIRRVVMKAAAELADRDAPQSDVYRVERRHVTKALESVLSDPDRCKRAIGLIQ